MTGLWKTWMTAWCWIVVAFGATLATAVLPATDGPARLAMAIIGGAPTTFDDNALRFAFSLMGALSMGWGLTVLALVRAGVSAETWRGVSTAVVLWYVVDSAASVATGFPRNAASNTLLLALFLTPVIGAGVWRAQA